MNSCLGMHMKLYFYHTSTTPAIILCPLLIAEAGQQHKYLSSNTMLFSIVYLERSTGPNLL